MDLVSGSKTSQYSLGTGSAMLVVLVQSLG